MEEKYIINDICDVVSSKRIYLSEYQDSGIPFYRGKEIIEKDSNKKISNELFISQERYNEIKEKFGVPKKGDILMTAVGTIGISWYVNEEDFYFKDGNLIWFKNFKKDIVNSRYLYYIFKSKIFSEIIKNVSIGSTQKAITIEQVKKIELEFPKIEIQNKIVKILDNISNKIKLNNKINNNLYEMCNVLYNQLLDDNKSNIEYKTIGEIAKKVITGKTPPTKNKEYWGGNIPFITIPDMHNQVFTINTERYITKEGAKSLIPKNSISVSCIATVGLVSINDKDSQTNQQINSIVIENDYDLYYLFEFLTEQEQYMKSIAGGSTTYNINKNTFENIQVPYLNKKLIIEYDKKVRPMFEKIKSNQISNDTLSQLRDTLLPKLMNGEIDLDNIEI